jgi:RimJ/RimL family protein N-acetyltransferase
MTMFTLGIAHLEPWDEGGLPLLEALNDPEMTKHVGGPETPEMVAERQAHYEPADSRQFKIVIDETGEAVGWVGIWERTWRDTQIYEIGWSVLPGFQGRGIATAATAQMIEIARAERRLRFLHAYPSIHNAPSNAICRKLNFTMLEECEFEFRGTTMRCNDWRLDLFAAR